MVDVAANYRKLIDRINEAAAKSGRDAQRDQTSRRRQIAEHRGDSRGDRGRGDSHRRELCSRSAGKEAAKLATPVEWHMIGHLQRNKAKARGRAVRCDRIAGQCWRWRESSTKKDAKRGQDRSSSCRSQSRRRGKQERHRQRTGGIVCWKSRRSWPHLRVEGLMTVPPFQENPEEVRPYFRELARVAAKSSASCACPTST